MKKLTVWALLVTLVVAGSALASPVNSTTNEATAVPHVTVWTDYSYPVLVLPPALLDAITLRAEMEKMDIASDAGIIVPQTADNAAIDFNDFLALGCNAQMSLDLTDSAIATVNLTSSVPVMRAHSGSATTDTGMDIADHPSAVQVTVILPMRGRTSQVQAQKAQNFVSMKSAAPAQNRTVVLRT